MCKLLVDRSLFYRKFVVVLDQLAEQAGQKAERQLLEGLYARDRQPLRLGRVRGELIGLEFLVAA